MPLSGVLSPQTQSHQSFPAPSPQFHCRRTFRGVASRDAAFRLYSGPGCRTGKKAQTSQRGFPPCSGHHPTTQIGGKTAASSRKRVGIIPPYPPGTLHLTVQRAGERIMSTLFLTGRQRNASPQFLLPPGEENRGKGIYRLCRDYLQPSLMPGTLTHLAGFPAERLLPGRAHRLLKSLPCSGDDGKRQASGIGLQASGKRTNHFQIPCTYCPLPSAYIMEVT
jgi:hypothetical protein